MGKPSVLVVGSSNTDMIIKVNRLPRSGETVLGGEFVSAAGGKGANQAVGAARAGGSVTFVGRTGADMFGAKAIAGLAADGIDVDFVVRDPVSPSGVALIYVNGEGENSIAVASGANGNLAAADVLKAKSAFQSARVVLAQLEIPLKAVEAAVGLAYSAGVRLILNPAPARPLPARLLKRVFLLTPNESESELLTGVTVNNEASAAAAAEKLLSRGVQNVIVTLGARGAFVAGPAVRQFVPAHRVKAVDATAAGDIFNGAVAVALAEGQSMLDAARFGTAAAAISVTRMGAQPSAPWRHEIDQMLLTGRLPARQRNGPDGWKRLSKTGLKRAKAFVPGKTSQ